MRTGLIQNLAQFTDIGSSSDKTGSNEVEALLDAEADIVAVALADIGHRQANAGNIDALVILHHTVIEHLAADGSIGGIQHGHADQTIIQQNGIAGFHIAGQVIISNGALGFIAFHHSGIQGEFRAALQFNKAIFEGLQTNFGTLGVQQCGDRQIHLLTQCFQRVQTSFVAGVVTVGKVEACHVHTGFQHAPQNALTVSGRAKGTDDFGFSHIYLPTFL